MPRIPKNSKESCKNFHCFKGIDEQWANFGKFNSLTGRACPLDKKNGTSQSKIKKCALAPEWFKVMAINS